jgi:hypothetical protein
MFADRSRRHILSLLAQHSFVKEQVSSSIIEKLLEKRCRCHPIKQA